MFTRRNNALPSAGLAGLVLLAMLGVAALRYATPEGMGLVNDSSAYLNGARSLLAGDGYARLTGSGNLSPITHFPPFYPLLLALVSRFTPSVFEAAAFINYALFGANIILVGWLALLLTRRSAAALLGAALFAASEALLRVHSFALSEPVFVLLTLATMIALCKYFEHHGSRVWIAVAGALTGLAYLTRYVGVALFAVVLLVLIAQRLAWKTRLAHVGIFLLGVLPPVLAWSLRNLLVADSVTNRQFGWHPVARSEWLEGLRGFWAFVVPSRLNVYSRVSEMVWIALLGVLLVLASVWLLRQTVRLVKTGGAPRDWLTALIGLHLLGYLALIVVSMTVMDASTIFEDRILAPVFVDALLLIVALLDWLARSSARGLRILALLTAAGLLLSGLDDTRRAANLLAVDGQGFASTAWAQSPTLAGLRALPTGAVYTNRLSAVNILTERPAYALLSDIDPVTLQARADYAETQIAIRASVLEGRAYLVVFDSAALLADPQAGWFHALVDGLPVRGEFSDGTIYGQDDAR